MNIPKYAEETAERLLNNGYEAYFVGGCVRDSLMGRVPHDYDITTNATPEEIKRCFDKKRVVTIGEKHGTIGILAEGKMIEVTTYRIDGEYTDNRRPETVTFAGNIADDLARRDFTMNAVAFGRDFIDPYGGREDIKKGIIRSVGASDRRFDEDALRILRALRFSAVLGFEIAEETKESIYRKKDLIKNISYERIYSEFKKMIMGKNAESVLLEFAEVIAVFIPEIKKAIGFDQKNRYHIYDVYTHSVKAMAACPFDETVRLAAFFHDIGKPLCFTEDEKGGHFYSHAKFSRELAEKALERLKADRNTKEAVLDLVSEHDRIINADKKCVRRVLAKYSPEFFDMLMLLKRGDMMAHAPFVHESAGYVDELMQIKEDVMRGEDCLSVKKLNVNGNDMMALGLRKREIGQMLDRLLEAVIDEEAENEHDALMACAADFVNLYKKIQNE